MKLLQKIIAATLLLWLLVYLMGDKMPIGVFILLALIPLAFYFAPKRDNPGHLILARIGNIRTMFRKKVI